MKHWKRILGAVVVAIAALLVYGVYWQINAPEVIIEKRIGDCEKWYCGLTKIAFVFDGEKYSGGSELWAAGFCGRLNPETIITLRSKGVFHQITGYKNSEEK